METDPLPGWPVEPEYVSGRQYDAGGIVQAPPPHPVVNHYYAAPPAKQGLRASTVLAWALAVVLACAALAAVAVVSVAVGIAAVAVAGSLCVLVVLLLIVRSVWRDAVSGKGPE